MNIWKPVVLTVTEADSFESAVNAVSGSATTHGRDDPQVCARITG